MTLPDGWKLDRPVTQSPTQAEPAAPPVGSASALPTGWSLDRPKTLAPADAANDTGEGDGDFMRGFKTTLPQLKQLGGGAAALVGEGLTHVGATNLGKSLKDYGLGVYADNEKKVEALSRPSDSFSSVLKGDGNLGDFLQYGTGYTAGQALESVASGLVGAGLGAAAGTVVPGAGNAVGGIGGGIGGLVAKAAVKKGLREAMASVFEKEIGEQLAKGATREVAEAAAKKAIAPLEKQAVKTGLRNIGAATGVGAFNLTQEAGSIYPEAEAQAQAEGRALSGDELAKVGAASLGAAGVETLTDLFMIGKVIGGTQGKQIVKRVLLEGAKGAGREGATEALQTAIERWGASQDIGSEEGLRDIIDSTALGVVGGGVAGGLTGTHAAEVKHENAPLQRPDAVSAPSAEAPAPPAGTPVLPYPGAAAGSMAAAANMLIASGAPAPAVARAAKPAKADDSGFRAQLAKQAAGGPVAAEIPAPAPVAASPLSNMDPDTGEMLGADAERWPNAAEHQQPTKIVEALTAEGLRKKGRPPGVTKIAQTYGIDADTARVLRRRAVAAMTKASLPAINDDEATPNETNAAAAADVAMPDAANEEQPVRAAAESAQAAREAVADEGEAAASASAPLDNRANDTPAADEQPVYNDSEDLLDDDIDAPSGGPFTIEDAAQRVAARTEGGKVFPVEGGFVVRTPNPSPSTQQADRSAPAAASAAPVQTGAEPANGRQEDPSEQKTPPAQSSQNQETPSPANSSGVLPGPEAQPTQADTATTQQADPTDILPNVAPEVGVGEDGARSQPPDLSTNPPDLSTNPPDLSTNPPALATARSSQAVPGSPAVAAAVETQGSPAVASPQTTPATGAVQGGLSPGNAIKLQEAHKALGRDVTRDQVQRARDTVAAEVESGTTNNGGVTAKLRPKAIESRKQQLARLDADLALFDAPTAPNVHDAAHQAATSPLNDLPEPTEAQKDAGNYSKGHHRIAGLDISIENPAGSRRRPEWPKLKHHYGYIRGTIGKDKDHVDVFMTNKAEDTTRPVYVIDQNTAAGKFDEHKVILGAATEEEARKAYLANYSKGWNGLGGIRQFTQEEFKAWVKDPEKTKRRAAVTPSGNPVRTAGGFAIPAPQTHPVDVTTRQAAIQADFAENRQAIKDNKFKKGDTVKWAENGKVVTGTILNLGDKEQAVVAVGRPGRNGGVQDSHVPASMLTKVEVVSDAPAANVTLFSLGANKAPIFTSSLTTSIETANGAPKHAKASVWREWLDGAQRRGEIKQEERDWMGVDDWLKGQTNVTRQQLLDYVRANSVQVTETALGDAAPRKVTMGQWEEAAAAVNAAINRNAPAPERNRLRDIRDNLRDQMNEASRATDATKFASYQLPGGANYRELLLTLPSDAPKLTPENTYIDTEETSMRGDADNYLFWYIRGPDNLYQIPKSRYATAEDALAYVLAEKKASPSSYEYRSSHFDQPNILAHVRFNERTDEDGKKVLFLEEVQSDWHQAGRKRGYAMAVRETADGWWGVYDRNGVLGKEYGTREKAESAAHESVPDAPFKTTWPMLAMKRVVRYAADNGFDRIAWTTGEQQAARYDLSKHVDELTYSKRDDGTYRFAAMKNGVAVVSEAYATEQWLTDNVGKDMAAKIVNGEGTPVAKEGYVAAHTQLSGVDLKVGGKGMVGFYDNILPKEVNKFAKRFGGKVGETTIESNTKTAKDLGSAGVEAITAFHDISGSFWNGLSRQAQNDLTRQYLEERSAPEAVKVHSLDITPAMRDAALQGLPMFSQAPAAAPARAETVANATSVDYDSVVRGIASRWRNGPKIEVVPTFADLPAAVKAEAARYGNKSQNVKAVFHNGGVVLVAENLESAAEVQAAVLHEALGHYGLRMIFGKNTRQQVQRLVNAMGGTGGILRYAKSNGINLAPYAAVLRDPNRTPEQQAAVLFDELFAHLAENRNKLAPGLRQQLAEFFGAIRNWLREHGMTLLAGRASDGELASLLSRAERALQEDVTARAPFFQGTRFSKEQAPPVELASTAFAGDTLTDRKHAAKEYAKERFAGPVARQPRVFNALDGSEIIIPWSGIKHALSGRINDAAIAAVSKIETLIEQATPVASYADNRARRNITGIASYEADAVFDGKPVTFEIVTRDHDDGRRYYDHFEVKREDPAPGESQQAAASIQVIAGPSDVTVTPTAEPGNSDTETRFSIAAPADVLDDIEAVMTAGEDATVLERARERLKELVPSKLKDQMRGTWLGALATRHLTELGADYFSNIKHYSSFLSEMGADRNKLQAEAEGVVERARKWAGKNRTEAKGLFSIMHDATIDGVDPAESFKPLTFRYGGQLHEATKKNIKDALKALREQMRGRAGDNKVDMLNEAKVLRGMPARERSRKAKYPSLVERWNALSPEAQQVYRDFRDMYADRSKQVEDGLVARINDTDAPDSHKQQIINVIRYQFETQRLQGVYFPLQRKGQYFVAAERGDTPAFLMFEKLDQLDRAVKELRARGFTIKAQGLKNAGKAQDAPSGTFVADVIRTMSKEGVSEKTQDEVYQLYLEALPEMSMRKHAIHRQAVPGFDPDAIRAFAFNMHHGAHQLARLRYAHKLQNVLDVLKKSQEDRRREEGADTRKIVAGDAILGELARRHEWIMNPQDSNATNLVSSFGFIYYLGLTPAAALVNLTQTALISYPYLASRFGAVKAMNHLMRGMGESIRTGGHIQRVLKDPEELRAHQVLQSMGAIDKTQAHNLAGIAEGGMQGYNPAWARAMEIIGWGFHKTEVVNREATGLAAFRMARVEGKSFAEAVNFAADTINDTHFDYTNANRARFMQSGTAKTLLMFRQYSLNMTWHLGRMVWNATKGESPEVKKIARRNLAGILAMSAVFSGTMGLPLMSIVTGVLNAIAATFGNDDDPWDAETEIRAFLNDMLGEGATDLVMNGGVNKLTGADIASRVSLSQLWFRDADRELDGRGAYYNLLEQAAGPMGGVLKNALVGKQLMDDGHLMRGVETTLPKSLKDMVKAARYATEGVNNLRGDPLLTDVGLWPTLLQLNGFTPAKVADQYDVNRSLKNYEQAILDRRQSIMDGYAMAVRLADPEGQRDALAKIESFNEANPEIPITRKGIKRSIKSRIQYSARAEAGIILNKKLAPRLQERVNAGGDD